MQKAIHCQVVSNKTEQPVTMLQPFPARFLKYSNHDSVLTDISATKYTAYLFAALYLDLYVAL